MVSHGYKHHKFPADMYGSPGTCECGVTFDSYCRMRAPKDVPSKGSKRCKKYSGVGIDSFSTPRWNQGLGCFTSSIRETERVARSKGLQPIGDCPLEKVFKEPESDSKKIVHEAMKEFRRERRTLTV